MEFKFVIGFCWNTPHIQCTFQLQVDNKFYVKCINYKIRATKPISNSLKFTFILLRVYIGLSPLQGGPMVNINTAGDGSHYDQLRDGLKRTGYFEVM